MTLYSIILFLHVTAVLGLFASLSFEFSFIVLSTAGVGPGRGKRWTDPAPGIPLVAMASVLVVLFSGIYMVVRMAVFDLAWPKVAIITLLMVAPFGALTGKRMRAIRRISAHETTMKPKLLKRLQDPFLKGFARRPNYGLLWDCAADGRPTRVMAIDRYCGVFDSSRSHCSCAGVASDWVALSPAPRA